MKFQRLMFPLCAALSLLVAQSTQAVTVQYLDGVTGLTADDFDGVPTAPTLTDTTDFSAAGIGKAGFVFFNWDAPAPTAGVYPNADVVSQNVNDQLPAWMSLDYDPNSATYSFGQDPAEESFAAGGIASWDTLTLPDGDVGLSGALIDPRAAGNSNNTIKELAVNFSGDFWLHVVTDNTNGDHDADTRFRARSDAGGSSRLNDLTAFNGSTDVYSFLYSGFVAGDYIKLQLRSSSTGEAPSIAGFMVDVVPEPTSAALLVLGGLGLISRRRRR